MGSNQTCLGLRTVMSKIILDNQYRSEVISSAKSVLKRGKLSLYDHLSDKQPLKTANILLN